MDRPGHGLDQLSIKSHPNVAMDISDRRPVFQNSPEVGDLDYQLAAATPLTVPFSTPLVEDRELAAPIVIAEEVQQVLIRRNVDPRLIENIISDMVLKLMSDDVDRT